MYVFCFISFFLFKVNNNNKNTCIQETNTTVWKFGVSNIFKVFVSCVHRGCIYWKKKKIL